MEISMQTRYLNSQDQLIISLNQQIEAMVPLKESFAALQRYQIKISHDFETILSQNEHINAAYSVKIHELLVINQEIDAQKNTLIDELRALENQKAKLILERKNLMSSCETLSSKFNLENQQNLLARQRGKQIIDVIRKTEQNIAHFSNIIAQIQVQVKLKASDNQQLEKEILRKVELNRDASVRVEQVQGSIKSVGIKNQKLVHELKVGERNRDQIQCRIREQIKKNRDLHEKNLFKKEELANLNHQKEYYTRLIQSEQLIKQDLDISEAKLNQLQERKLKELQRIHKENADLQTRISQHENSYHKSRAYKEALSDHLNELVKTNTVLLETMRRCCKEDERAHQVLNKKVEGLQIASIRCADAEMLNHKYRKTTILRERTNQIGGLTKAEKSGSTWINELNDLENRG